MRVARDAVLSRRRDDDIRKRRVSAVRNADARDLHMSMRTYDGQTCVQMLLSFEVGKLRSCRYTTRLVLLSPRAHRRPLWNGDTTKGLLFNKPKLKRPSSRLHTNKPKRYALNTYAGTLAHLSSVKQPDFMFLEYTSWPFSKQDFKRVIVRIVKMITTVPAQGTLLLVEDKYDVSDEEIDSRGLMVHVGGDTLTAINFAAQEREPERPMSLQLLHNILEYHRELQPLEWHLLHVAIVDIREDVFIGRLFFGNPETGEIRYDCDCRPSDACWLSMKKMCPIYVRNSVWETCAQPMEKLFSSQIDVRSTLEKLGVQTDPSSVIPTKTSDPLTTIMPSDPMVIKRLKREMAVAVTEEDYSTAARIRDHPYMIKYKSIFDLKKEGKNEQALRLEQELRQQIERDESMEGDV